MTGAIDGSGTARARCLLAPNPSPMTLDGTNTWVIAEPGSSSAMVVDPGPGDEGHLSRVREEVEAAGQRVERILLTHAHPDHAGNAEQLRSEHHTPVHTHAAEAPNARGEIRERITTGYMLSRLWWPKMLSFVVNAVTNGAARPAPLGEVETFDGATPLGLPGHPIPLFTPGHTSGHCAFHLPDRGVLISGDALVTHDSLTQETGARILNRAFNHDQAETIRSLQRLRGISADIILPGHGEPYHGSPSAAVEQALAHI